METVTYYKVNGYSFKSKELATIAETIMEKYPNLNFCFLDDKIFLKVPSYDGSADINITESGVELQFYTHDPSATTQEIMELEKQGIYWNFLEGFNILFLKNEKVC